MFAGHRLFRLRASGREYAWVSRWCGTSVARQRAVMRSEDGQTGGRPRHGMPRREPTGSVRLRRPCRRRRAAVVAPHGAFSGVDQGRHVNQLLVGLPYLALNMCRLPGCPILSMRTTGSLVDRGHTRRYATCEGRLRSLDVGSAAARLCCTLTILTLKRQRLPQLRT